MSIKYVVNDLQGFAPEEFQVGVDGVTEIQFGPDGFLRIVKGDGSETTFYRYPVKEVKAPDPAPTAPVTP